MPDFAELEFGLHRQDAASYAIDFRLSLPESDADIRLSPHKPALVEFDLAALQARLCSQAGRNLTPEEIRQFLPDHPADHQTCP